MSSAMNAMNSGCACDKGLMIGRLNRSSKRKVMGRGCVARGIKGAGGTPFGCAQDKPALRKAIRCQDDEVGFARCPQRE